MYSASRSNLSNGLGVGQALDDSYANLVERLANQRKKTPNCGVPRPLKLGRAHNRSLNKSSCSLCTRIQFILEFGETERLPDLPRQW